MSTADYLPDGTLILDAPVQLPPVLDALIVGGGPVGTAAAFRAKELGFSALVVDYDELMKRIRDYPKDKQILPDFGGGDHMQFPRGGDVVRRLQFAAIDKDRLCTDWKGLYRQHNVPAQIGLELTGLERDKDVWRARIWNHNTKSDVVLAAKHVVIGVGRGVPRRLDIPGNVAGLAFQFTDAARYIGRPVCVIGGGTSAAEAVIAISNAKSAASDESGVFWSYRGDKMPKVSKALADVFFEAYLGNGNIRYLPKSEPMAVMSAGEGQEVLCVRIDRKLVAGRPCETVQLEFLKGDCIACIGEDIPEALLNSFGIFLVTGGPSAKKRMVVSPLLESQLPNVYLTGDMLSPAYLEADDFDGDPATFREVKRRGNIKAALRDGVFVAEVISQKLAGKRDISVALEFDDVVAAAPAEMATVKHPPSASAGPAATGMSLVRLLPGNVEADAYPVTGAAISIGRIGCDINFPDDSMLSDRHAALVAGPGGYILRDEGSANGLFIRLRPNVPMDFPVGGIVRAGQQWVVRGADRMLSHYSGRGEKVGSHPLRDGTLVVGREAPDITLDPTDTSLSRRHFALVVRDGSVVVNDLGSANGTLVKISAPITLRGGEQICMGAQVLQFTIPAADENPSSIVHRVNPDAAPRPAPPPAPAAPKTAPATAAPAAAQVVSAGASVTFQPAGKTCPIRKDQTICQLAEAQGITLQADCHQGICGSDPIRIVSGAEHLTKMGDAERSALEDICSLSPAEHRLACMARVTGPVSVQIL